MVSSYNTVMRDGAMSCCLFQVEMHVLEQMCSDVVERDTCSQEEVWAK